MRISQIRAYLLVLLFPCFSQAIADSSSLPITPDVTAFVAQIVDAHNALGFDKTKEPLCNTCLTAITPQVEAFYAARHKISSKKIPRGYTINLIAVDPKEPLLMEEQFFYPVRPTHSLNISWTTTQDDPRTISSGSVVLYVVQENGEWKEILPIPGEQMMKEFVQWQQSQSKL